MFSDPNGLNNHAVRKALEFVASNRAEIEKAQGVAGSSTTRLVIKEAERQRAEVIRMIERVGLGATDSIANARARQIAEQVAYIRRAVEPLSADKLAEQMAANLGSEGSLGAKMVAMEVVREQASLRRTREEGLGTNAAVAGLLVDEARTALSTAGIRLEDLEWVLPKLEQKETRGAEVPEDPRDQLPDGIKELVRVIREEGAATRREAGMTRQAIQQEGTRSQWRGNLALTLAIAALLVGLAQLYLQASEPTPRLELPGSSTELDAEPRAAARENHPFAKSPGVELKDKPRRTGGQ